MLQQFFNINFKIWQYILVWIIFAVLHTFAVAPLVSLSLGMVFADSFVYSVFYGLIGILLWSVIKYGNFGSLPVFQRVINYAALAVLTVLLTIGLGYGFEYMVDESVADTFLPLMPVRIFISILVYIALTQNFKLKSLDEEILENELNEPAATVHSDRNDDEPELDEPDSDKEILERIAVKTGQKIHVIMIPEIIYLQADGDYVHIFTTNGKYLKEQTMKYFEEHLPYSQFVRVHRSCIVNVEAISRIELYEKQNQQLTLKNGHQIKVSQAGYKLLRTKLNL
jgi:hypothetical protein